MTAQPEVVSPDAPFPATVDEPIDWQAKVKAAKEAGYSDGEIAGFLLKQPQADAARKAGYSDEELLKHFGLSSEGASASAKPQTKVTWERTLNAADAATLGAAPYVAAAGEAAKVGPNQAEADFINPFPNFRSNARELLNTPGPAIPKVVNPLVGPGPEDAYSQALAAYKAARGEYNKENPLTSLGIDILGSSPALIAGGEGLASGIRAIPGVGNFLTGGAGYGVVTGPRAGRALPGAAALGARVLSQGVAGAIQGAATGAASSGLEGPDLGTNTELGALTGLATGSTLGPLANRIVNAWRGPEIDPGVAEAALRAIGPNGIPLRMGNVTGRGDVRPDQIQAFTRALARTIGEDTDRLTPRVMDRAAQRIGADLDAAGTRTGIALDPTLDTDLTRVEHAIATSAANPAELRGLEQEVNRVHALLISGPLSGGDYQTITNTGSRLNTYLNSRNADVAHLARQARDALRDAVARTSGPDEAAALAQARAQWKNLRTLQQVTENNPLTGRPVAGPEMEQLWRGIIERNPEAFRGRAGELGSLGEIGQEFLSGKSHQDMSAVTKMGIAAAEIVSTAGMAHLAHLFVADPIHAAALIGFPATASGLAAAVHFMRNSPRFAQNQLLRSMQPEAVGLGGRYLLPGEVEAANRSQEGGSNLLLGR